MSQTAIHDHLAHELMGVFEVREIWSSPERASVTFAGNLIYEPDSSYDEIVRRLQPYGYTPILRHHKNKTLLIAVESGNKKVRTGNPMINLLLLLLTMLTTIEAGANLAGSSGWQLLRSGSWQAWWQSVQIGLPFAVTLMLILWMHELGHYLAARWHKVSATLPYFIPVPFIGIGTMGAFIALKSPMKDRRTLFDIGLAGPIAGLLVALPLTIAGIYFSDIVPVSHAQFNALTLHNAGSSLLLQAIIFIIKPISADQTLLMHPIFFSAWIGLLITGINLLPAGQLDGGHIAYALLGKWAHRVAFFIFGSLILLGIGLQSWNWLVWAFFILLGGLRHPPPLNDVLSLNPTRKLIGWSAFLLLLLLIVPRPFG